MRILGIETSCDETSASIIEVDPSTKVIRLLSNVISSSANLHAKTGGIIPEIAAREQLRYIVPVIDEALKQAKSIEQIAKSTKNTNPKRYALSTVPDIDAIAVTVGPGLIGSLIVGVETAKTLSFVWNKPIIPVNHLFGHIYANFIGEHKEIDFPAIALIVSGGHTDLVLMKDEKKIKWLAGTRDDAAGEAYDKVGRLLGLTYPAGPEIEKLAKKGDPKRFKFPRPLIHEDTLDFSFSGLKTAVLREVQKLENEGVARVEGFPTARSPLGLPQDEHWREGKPGTGPRGINIDKQTICDISFATQDAIIDVLINKTMKAVLKYNAKSILLGGGVAANQTLIKSFKEILNTKYEIRHTNFLVPAKILCTDNAAMIAAASSSTLIPFPGKK